MKLHVSICQFMSIHVHECQNKTMEVTDSNIGTENSCLNCKTAPKQLNLCPVDQAIAARLI